MNPTGLRQPDQRSCGAAVAVVARMQADPDYEARARPRFAAEVLQTHRRLTRTVLRGRRQLPWPRALGTPPWSVARELTALTGVEHRVRLVRLAGRLGRRSAGRGAALYVGSRWLPRHVVLVVDDHPTRCYDPASGRAVPLDGRPVAGWRYPWFVVAPR